MIMLVSLHWDDQALGGNGLADTFEEAVLFRRFLRPASRKILLFLLS